MSHSLDGLVQSLLAVGSEGVTLHFGPEEQVDLLLECGAAREEARGQPEQLPATLLTGAELVLCQLLDDLAVDLISEWLLERGGGGEGRERGNGRGWDGREGRGAEGTERERIRGKGRESEGAEGR